MARISLENISFRYPGAPEDTLTGLQLDIADGEAHALLGASGAGKTTLLNLLSGLLVPSTGKLLFDEADVSQLTGRDRNVAQVFQFPVLYESLTVAENLAFPLNTRGADTTTAAARVDYICNELGIFELRSRKAKTLSLFEKQLVAVGKALVREDVSLILLDEPLTAVEPKIKWHLRQTLRKVQRDTGVTMIYVTHDQTEALTFADRVSVLTAGGILQTGTPGEIYQAPEHEFVGHFVGSPGMNFLPNSAIGATLGERLGFRPEWAVIDSNGPVKGVVARARVQGTRDGAPFGLVTLETEYGDLSVRGVADLKVGTETALRVLRYVAFTDKQKVGECELV